MKEIVRRNIAFPVDFLAKVKIEAVKTCRNQSLYIQYCVKEFWKMQEKEQKE